MLKNREADNELHEAGKRQLEAEQRRTAELAHLIAAQEQQAVLAQQQLQF